MMVRGNAPAWRMAFLRLRKSFNEMVLPDLSSLELMRKRRCTLGESSHRRSASTLALVDLCVRRIALRYNKNQGPGQLFGLEAGKALRV